MFELRQAFEWLDSAVLYGRGDEQINAVSTDSRQVTVGSLYVPLRGERFDGHEFIDQAKEAQATAYLFESSDAVDPPAVRVPDTRRALGELARGWRAQFDLPVIAVLGSNGKTTVKEMLATIVTEAVGELFALSTAGNFNNDIGVPLSVLRLRAEHRLAVFELGMNHPGEIGWLCEIAQPSVAVITNAQREHQEFLDGVAATAHENGVAFALLPSDGIAVYPGDDDCASIWCSLAGTRRTFCFGYANEAGQFDVWASAQADPSAFELHIERESYSIALQIDGAHNVRNALAAAAAAYAVGIAGEVIACGLSRFTPAAGRLRRMPAPNGVVLIDDTYNANPDSVRAAIDVLVACPEPRVLVLGDMGELGANALAWHAEVGQYARERGITTLLAHGELSAETARVFGANAHHFNEMAEICTAATGLAQPGVSMLVKGSKFMKMKTVIAAVSAAAVAQAGGLN